MENLPNILIGLVVMILLPLVIAFTLVYCSFAFYHLSFDPNVWGKEARFGFILMFILLSIPSIGVMDMYQRKEMNN